MDVLLILLSIFQFLALLAAAEETRSALSARDRSILHERLSELFSIEPVREGSHSRNKNRKHNLVRVSVDGTRKRLQDARPSNGAKSTTSSTQNRKTVRKKTSSKRVKSGTSRTNSQRILTKSSHSLTPFDAEQMGDIDFVIDSLPEIFEKEEIVIPKSKEDRFGSNKGHLTNVPLKSAAFPKSVTLSSNRNQSSVQDNLLKPPITSSNLPSTTPMTSKPKAIINGNETEAISNENSKLTSTPSSTPKTTWNSSTNSPIFTSTNQIEERRGSNPESEKQRGHSPEEEIKFIPIPMKLDQEQTAYRDITIAGGSPTKFSSHPPIVILPEMDPPTQKFRGKSGEVTIKLPVLPLMSSNDILPFGTEKISN